jgi:Protein of unknown function (DUF3830)
VSKVKITLGGVQAFAELDEHNAPRTTRWLKGALPIAGQAIHSMENGREVYLVLEDEHQVPDENQTIYQTVGDLLVYYKPAIFVQPEWPRHVRDFLVVSFVYERDTAIRGIAGALATNVVGTITEGLDALAHEAPRMRREGMGPMTITPV